MNETPDGEIVRLIDPLTERWIEYLEREGWGYS